jgi:hypothetical protein
MKIARTSVPRTAFDVNPGTEATGHGSGPGAQRAAGFPGLGDRTEAEMDARAIRLSETFEAIFLEAS